ncbi:MAG: ABC transporter substrate-binding protein, partial [Chloroflexota bacterium]
RRFYPSRMTGHAPPASLSRRALLSGLGGAALASRPFRARADGPRPLYAATNPEGEPLDGGAVVVGAMREPASLHPWEPASGVSADILAGVCEGLFTYNAAGRLQPALATSVSLDEDGLTYVFELRQDVRFHDGSRFTGDDVRAAWNARLDGQWAPAATLGWERVAAVEVDGATLTIRTTEPYAPFLSTVAITPIVPAAALDEGPDAFRQRFREQPVGTGPFAVSSWKFGERIRLERFGGWWGGTPGLDRIDVRFPRDAAALLAGLESGSIDLAVSLPLSTVGAAAALPGLTVWKHLTPNWQHLDLKQVGFLRETAVRQALDYATPRRRIVSDLMNGYATPAFADQMPGSWAFDEDLDARPFDPVRAAGLLEAAGFAPGRDGILQRDGEPFRIELWGVAGDALAEAILAEIAAEWAGLGIAAIIRTASPAALWGPMGYQFTDRMTACLYTWTNGPDPDNLFYWHSSQIPSSPTAPGGNVPAFFHPYAFQDQLDDLTARGASTLDVDERAAIYRDLQALLREESAAIFLYWEHAFPASRRDMAGFWPNPTTGLLWNAAAWRRVWAADPRRPGAAPAATPVAARTAKPSRVPSRVPPATPTR